MKETSTPTETEGDGLRDSRAQLPRFILATAHLTLSVVSAFAYLSQQHFPITGFDRRAFGTPVVVLALAAMWPYIASWIACRHRIQSTTIFRSIAFVLVLLAGAATVVAFFLRQFGAADWWRVIVVTAVQATIYVALAPLALGDADS